MKQFQILCLFGLLSLTALKALELPQKHRDHFNQVMQTHLEAIALAEEEKELFPNFDTSKGISAWWRQLATDGGVDALLNDDAIYELAQELYAISITADRYQKAVKHLEEVANADTTTIEEAKFQVQVQFVHALRMEIKRRGCMLRRPDDRVKTDDLKPAQGGSFVAADEQNWGKNPTLQKPWQRIVLLTQKKMILF